ncbi:MAG: ABC transporter permease [Candidatus Methanoperedens sp.]
MKLADTFEYIYISFLSNKFKTILSSLGIIIGVIAIVVMLSVGEGLYVNVKGAMGNLDLNTLTITPGSLSSGDFKKNAELTEKDVKTIESIPGVKFVSPRKTISATIISKENERTITFVGIYPSKEQKLGEGIMLGRFLTESDQNGVVLKEQSAQNMFRIPLNPGSIVKIKNNENGKEAVFKIVGVLAEAKQSYFGGVGNAEMYTTLKSLEDISNGSSYSMIQVTVEESENVEEMGGLIQESLERSHRNEALSIIAMKTFLEMVNKVMGMIKIALGGIGLISLVVGGIGIVNVMMLTVNERVKEIGTMKAMGATEANIRTLFVFESGFLGLISGLIGVVLGSGIALLISSIGAFPLEVTWSSVLIGLGFGVITTMVAGIYPASRAARLDPIEAFRAE